MKRTLCLLSLFLVFSTLPAVAETTVPQKSVQVAVVMDGPSERLEAALAAVKSELMALTRREFEVQFPPDQQIVGDWSRASIETATESLLANEQVELLLAFGVIASDIVVSRQNRERPCLAPFVLNERLQGLHDGSAPQHRDNLSYVVWELNLERDLQAFQEIGSFQRIAWVHNGFVSQAIPFLIPTLQQKAAQVGTELIPVAAGEAAAPTLQQLSDQVDAVYFAPNAQMADAERRAFANGLMDRRLPSFAWFGRSDVELGFLSGLATADDVQRLSRRVALNAQSILLGERPAELVHGFKQVEQLSINMQTARSISLWPNWTVLTDAVLIGQHQQPIARKLDLSKAVRQAMESNLDLAAMRQMVTAGRAEIRRARANLLPQLSANIGATMIDADRAGLGNFERSAQFGGTLSQSIYDERAWANLDIQEAVQESRVQDQQSLKLDVALEVATAYLNLLQAQTVERIRRENLTLSRDNLALARLRQRLGSAGPGEVLRWEAQIAQARSDVIAAVASRNQLEILVNRLLNRPLEEPFATKEATISDPLLAWSDPRLQRALNNPFHFKVLREFLEEEGIRRSPELQGIQAALRATGRRVRSAKRSLYLPRFGLSASAAHRFYEDGVGSEGITLPPAIPSGLLPNPDRNSWQVGVSATFPLYEGGRRYAEIEQSQAENAQLKTQEKALRLGIAQRVRSTLHQAGASFAAIRLSQQAAAAAKENLRLVSDAYSRGAALVVVLLDAQNQALVAELTAANAAYRFLSDLMSVERSIGTFSFFSNEAEREALLSRLASYQARRAAEVRSVPAAP